MTTMQERYRELRGSGLEHGEALSRLAEEREEERHGLYGGKVAERWATAADYRAALERIAAGTDNPRDVARKALACPDLPR